MQLERTQFFGFITGVAVVLIAVGLWGYTTHVTNLQAAMQSQHEEMLANATLLDRSAPNEQVASVVRDCSSAQREEFDSLLSQLDTLNATELAAINTLFADCGGYFAQIRAVMVLQLETQLAHLAHQSQVLQSLPFADAHGELITAWEALLSREQTRADYATSLVRIQRSIISTLQAGVGRQEEAIVLLLNEANETRESLSLVGAEIDAIRDDQLTPWPG